MWRSPSDHYRSPERRRSAGLIDIHNFSDITPMSGTRSLVTHFNDVSIPATVTSVNVFSSLAFMLGTRLKKHIGGVISIDPLVDTAKSDSPSQSRIQCLSLGVGTANCDCQTDWFQRQIGFSRSLPHPQVRKPFIFLLTGRGGQDCCHRNHRKPHGSSLGSHRQMFTENRHRQISEVMMQSIKFCSPHRNCHRHW